MQIVTEHLRVKINKNPNELKTYSKFFNPFFWKPRGITFVVFMWPCWLSLFCFGFQTYFTQKFRALQGIRLRQNPEKWWRRQKIICVTGKIREMQRCTWFNFQSFSNAREIWYVYAKLLTEILVTGQKNLHFRVLNDS